MPARFAEKWSSLQYTSRHSALLIRPRLTRMPLPMQRYDDPFLPFGKSIISATQSLVSLYIFDFASYLAIGAAGIVALERTIAFANNAGGSLTVLHMPVSSEDYTVALSDNALNVDGLTVSDASVAAAYLASGFGVFLVEVDLTGAGMLSMQDRRVTYPPNLQLSLFSDEVVYASGGEDFAVAARMAMERPL